MRAKDCSTCVYGLYEEDMSVGIFPHYDCDNPEVSEDYDDNELPPSDGSECTFYRPKVVGNCCKCAKVIDSPLVSWELFATNGIDTRPACSESCKSAYESECCKQICYMEEYGGR